MYNMYNMYDQYYTKYCVPCKVVNSNVVLFDNVVNPDTLNDDANVTILLNIEIPLIFNELNVVFV
jgi:hypothetical protein